MPRLTNFTIRCLVDILISFALVGGFVAASHQEKTDVFWLVFAGVTTTIIMVGYFESSAKRVWVHAVLLMLPELLALPVVALTCRGFECAGIIAFLIAASLFTIVLVGLAYVGFLLRKVI